jgi:hypothetical protein
MKKIILSLFILLFAFALGSFSQDIIYKTDGSKEEAKIILVGEKEIQFKKFNNLEGPIYTLSKKDIVLVTYQNGEYETIVNADYDKKAAKVELSENFTKNLMTYHLFDVIYGDFTISYERILSSGTVGIVIPLGIGYAYNSDYYNSSENWVKNMIYSGIGINFYPTGQGKWRYFIGPNVRIGYGKQGYWTSYYYDENGNYVESGEESNEGIYTKFFVDNGIIFTPVKHFSISSVVGVGIRYFPEVTESHSAVLPSAYFSINISYRF